MEQENGRHCMKQHRCRDCKTIELHPEKVLCESCKAKAKEREKQKKREWDKTRVRRKTYVKKPKKPEIKYCRRCGDVREPNKTYCAKCRVEVIKEQQGKRQKQNLKYDDPLEFIPPTNLDWLDGFNAYLKQNGGVYNRKQI
jgi:hypothetical protein